MSILSKWCQPPPPRFLTVFENEWATQRLSGCNIFSCNVCGVGKWSRPVFCTLTGFLPSDFSTLGISLQGIFSLVCKDGEGCLGVQRFSLMYPWPFSLHNGYRKMPLYFKLKSFNTHRFWNSDFLKNGNSLGNGYEVKRWLKCSGL